MSKFEYLPDIILHLSKMKGINIVYQSGIKLGSLNDLFVDYDQMYPLVIAIQYEKNNQYFYIPWDDISTFSLKKVVVRDEGQIGRSRTFPRVHKSRSSNLLNQLDRADELPSIGKMILDQQIVDTDGKKVVRVNDIQLIKAGQFLRVTHAEVGLTSMLRRIGLAPLLALPFLNRETLINWKYVHTVPSKNKHRNVKLSLNNSDLKKMHPADLADILEELDNHGRELLFNELDPALAAQTLTEVEEDIQSSLIKDGPVDQVAKIIENMGTDEAADVLSELSVKRADEIISNFTDTEHGEEIQVLLAYDEDTAGGLMSTEVFAVKESARKSDILDMIENEYEDIESIYDIFIVDDLGELKGTCSLSKLLIQKENIEVSHVMNSQDIKSIDHKTHWRDVASFMSKYNLINVPIVDDNNKLLGLISIDDVLPWLLDER